MKKPIILAICGKSASGKDTLAKWLKSDLDGMNIPSRYIISDTTRPKRINEQNGIDYYFISRRDFYQNIVNKRYLEWTRFRNWLYGTYITEIHEDEINIGVFNARGLESLSKRQNRYDIIPIYLDDSLITRLQRSYQREQRWRLEYFRRAFADWREFKNINKTLNKFFDYLIIENEQSLVRKTRKVLFGLQDFGIISAGKKLKS